MDRPHNNNKLSKFQEFYSKPCFLLYQKPSIGAGLAIFSGREVVYLGFRGRLQIIGAGAGINYWSTDQCSLILPGSGLLALLPPPQQFQDFLLQGCFSSHSAWRIACSRPNYVSTGQDPESPSTQAAVKVSKHRSDTRMRENSTCDHALLMLKAVLVPNPPSLWIKRSRCSEGIGSMYHSKTR